MYLELSPSDVIIFSIAVASLVGIVVLELIRVVLPDLYAWMADHKQVQKEIREGRVMLERMTAQARDLASQRDRKNAERFRLKSQLSRVEMTLGSLERERVEVWHEIGRQLVGEGLYIAGVNNPKLGDMAKRDFDQAPVIWRYGNRVRVWAPTEHKARTLLATTFPTQEGYNVLDLHALRSSTRSAG